MLGAEVVLAELRIQSDPLKEPVVYRIESWEGYGVVCPGRMTTNGSATTLIASLPLWGPTYEGQPRWIRWDAQHPSMPTSLPRDPLELWDALVTAYEILNPSRSASPAERSSALERAARYLQRLHFSRHNTVQPS